MKRISQVFFGVAGIALVAGGVWFGVMGIKWVVDQLAGIESETLKIVIPASATILVGFLGVLVQKHAEKRKEIEMKLREEKVKVYNALMVLMFDLMKQSKASKQGYNQSAKEAEFEEHFIETTRQLLMWASDGVVSKYYAFRASAQAAPAMPPILLGSLGELLLEIRRDLGHNNRGVSANELLSFFITDAEQLMRKS